MAPSWKKTTPSPQITGYPLMLISDFVRNEKVKIKFIRNVLFHLAFLSISTFLYS